MPLFDGDIESSDVFIGEGIALRSDITIVVQLSGPYRQYIYIDFKIYYLTETEINQRIDSRLKCYGIIDGPHSHEAIKTLMAKHDRWCGYMCFVCLVNGGHSLDWYQQSARVSKCRK